jgi:ribokinase
MVTVDPGVRASAADVAGLSPRAVALSLDQLYAVPEGSAAYVTVGDDDARAYAGRPPALLGRARALFVNQREALGLTNELTIDAAAARLAEMVDTVIVTLGPGGAIAVSAGERCAADVVGAVVPVDTTGAGVLLASACSWADLPGADTCSALEWATLYASTAVGSATGIGGAMTERELLAAGDERGLTMPPALSASAD